MTKRENDQIAARKNDPITDKDLADFVTNDSDFAFEMRVVTELRDLGFECSHSGTSRDPVTDKIRQFDIRALTDHRSYTLALAVECKNLGPNHPLLISAVPRTEAEAFHDLIVYRTGTNISASEISTISGLSAYYKEASFVGKKTDQVRRDADGKLTSDDSATFDKISQAVNSCKDLVRTLVFRAGTPHVRVIVPVLVVPPDMLWQVEYEANGTLRTAPRRITRTTLFLNHTWSEDRGVFGRIDYRLSHIEIITLSALRTIVGMWLGSSGFFRGVPVPT